MNTPQDTKTLLLRVADAIVREPSRFSPYETSIPNALSRGCICSFLVRELGFTNVTPDVIYDEARRALSPSSVDDLFSTDNWPQELYEELIKCEEGSPEMAQVAKKVIEWYIATYHS